jgi:hypothetical protein
MRRRVKVDNSKAQNLKRKSKKNKRTTERESKKQKQNKEKPALSPVSLL